MKHIQPKWLTAVALLGALTLPVSAALAVQTLEGSQEPAKKKQDDKKKGDEKKKDDEKKDETLKVGSVVPETLALPDLDGERHSFKDLRGKIVVLHFWSDRCPYEEHANPIFAKMEKRFEGSDDVVMIGIDSNHTELGDRPKKDADHSKHYTSMRKKMKEAGVTHPMLADHGNVVADLFAAQSTPHCFVIDAKGKIRYAGALDDDPRGQKGDDATNYVLDAVAAVKAGEDPKVANTKPYGCSIKRVEKVQ